MAEDFNPRNQPGSPVLYTGPGSSISQGGWGAVPRQGGGYYVQDPETGAITWIDAPATAAAPATPSAATGTSTDPLQALTDAIFGASASDTGTGMSGGVDPATGQSYTSNIMSKLLSAESQFIPEMLSASYRSTPAGSAAFESAAEPIDAKFDQAKDAALRNAAMQGVAPTSGIVMEQLQQIENERAQAKSDLERQFNAALPNRQQAGLSQLTDLLGMQQQRALQSLGIQQSLDEAQRQRYLDAAAIGGNQGAAAAMGAAGQAGNLLNAASNLSNVYGNRAANQAAGLGSIIGSVPWGRMFPSTPASGPTAADTMSAYTPQTVNQPGDIYTGSAPAWWGGGANY